MAGTSTPINGDGVYEPRNSEGTRITNGTNVKIFNHHSEATKDLVCMKKRLLPLYKDLTEIPGMPHGCAWGIWDSDGEKDELGSLNLLTPEVKIAAKNEIQFGISVALNWSLDNCATPHSHRKKPEHRIMPLPDWTGHDDEIHMNTQSGSQWDGFRRFSILLLGILPIVDKPGAGHWAHQPTGLYYNGVKHADITDPKARKRNGIDRKNLFVLELITTERS